MTVYKIDIDMDQSCPKCGKKGSCNGGLCLKCITKAIESRIREQRRKRERIEP
jgi:hypothetical protein